MSDMPTPADSIDPAPRFGLNVWHWMALIAFISIVIRNIQDQRMTEPLLIGAALLGFLGYGVLGTVAWKASRGLEPRLGRVGRTAIYLGGMSLLFLLATWIYLMIEYYYRTR